MLYTVEWPFRNVVNVRLDFTKRKEWWFLLRSDAHHDNRHCDLEMETRHLEEAKARDAGVFDNGDLFCAMQGKWDKREDKDQMRPEHWGNNYLDKLVTTAADFYEPYAGRFLFLAHGNHETSILKHHQTDLTERLCAMLNDRTGSNIRNHGYAGWVIFRCERSNQRGSIRKYRHHGYGGGAPVTKGVIHTARMAVYLPDANIIWTGHTHTEYIVPIARDRINDAGRVYQDEQTHIRTAGYKNGRSDGFGGWEVEKGLAPTTTGAHWLRVYWESPGFHYEVTRAA